MRRRAIQALQEGRRELVRIHEGGPAMACGGLPDFGVEEHGSRMQRPAGGCKGDTCVVDDWGRHVPDRCGSNPCESETRKQFPFT